MNQEVSRPGIPPEDCYTLEDLASLAEFSSDAILAFQAQGLLRAAEVCSGGSPVFDDSSLLTLRRIQYLRGHCGMNDEGLRVVFHLLEEMELLREGLRLRE